MILLKKISSTGYNEVSLSSVIDSDLGDASKEKRERLDTILTALSCKNAPFGVVFPLLKNHAEAFVDQEDFRNSLYDYLQKYARMTAKSLGKQLIHCMDLLPIDRRSIAMIVSASEKSSGAVRIHAENLRILVCHPLWPCA